MVFWNWFFTERIFLSVFLKCQDLPKWLTIECFKMVLERCPLSINYKVAKGYPRRYLGMKEVLKTFGHIIWYL